MRRFLGAMVVAGAAVWMAGCTAHRADGLVQPDGLLISPMPHVVSVGPYPSGKSRKPFRIDAARSWASYRGERLALRAEPHPYRTDLHLIDPDPEGRRPEAGLWRAGVWHLHLAFEGQPPTQDVDVTFTMRTRLTLGLLPVVFGAPFAP